MPIVNTTGAKLYVEETGSGYPIVFVHEFGSDLREWEAQVRWFSRSYRCVTYNARGYPPSEVPSDPNLYGYEFAVNDIAAVMKGLAIEKAHIVGLSMGAYAALLFGLRYPQMASALVVAGVGSGSPPEQRATWQREAEATSRSFVEQGMAAAAETMGAGPTRIQLRQKDPRGFDLYMQHLRDHSADGMSLTMAGYQARRPSLHDFAAQFAQMQIPVLLAVGDEDAPCLATNLFLKQQMPTAGLWVVPNTGHAINLEEPMAFNQAVQDFLGSAERGRWRA